MGVLAMTLTNKQLAFLHVLKKLNGLNDDEYRDLLEEAAGVRTASELTGEAFSRVLNLMETLGYEVNQREVPPQFGNRPGMATQRQIDFIYGMGRKVFVRDNEIALSHWLEHKFYVSHLRFLDRKTAGKAIEGLKAMINRKDRNTSRPNGGQE
ncbi:MAG: hypothetical protein BVN35_20365 [Proteobacteria bacterium ST_bin11]|nr:MAG: hypothetical protein BVN35_20365 [Proteobacteria bacterium ST_bin11]